MKRKRLISIKIKVKFLNKPQLRHILNVNRYSTLRMIL